MKKVFQRCFLYIWRNFKVKNLIKKSYLTDRAGAILLNFIKFYYSLLVNVEIWISEKRHNVNIYLAFSWILSCSSATNFFASSSLVNSCLCRTGQFEARRGSSTNRKFVCCRSSYESIFKYGNFYIEKSMNYSLVEVHVVHRWKLSLPVEISAVQ